MRQKPKAEGSAERHVKEIILLRVLMLPRLHVLNGTDQRNQNADTPLLRAILRYGIGCL